MLKKIFLESIINLSRHFIFKNKNIFIKIFLNFNLITFSSITYLRQLSAKFSASSNVNVCKINLFKNFFIFFK